MKLISAIDAFRKLQNPNGTVFIDVRSENEFQEGHFNSVVNIPILNNEHRHQVGLAYKNKGQDTAIKLGHELVDPLKPKLVKQWAEVSRNQETIVYCWRGGLRSKISCSWMEEGKIPNLRVEGGYKAIRQEVRPYFSKTWPMILVTGMTGSQKTELIQEFTNHIDLEALANHRGSAFGLLIRSAQPRQATFENNLAVALAHQATSQNLIFEDESRLIGHCIVPPELYAQMSKATLVQVNANPAERAQHIYKSYILLSQQRAEKGQVREHFQKSLLKLSKRLGGLLTDQLLKLMNEAFFHESPELHQQWIESLLVNYYDKLYLYSLKKKGRPVVFQGSKEEVKQYLKGL